MSRATSYTILDNLGSHLDCSAVFTTPRGQLVVNRGQVPQGVAVLLCIASKSVEFEPEPTSPSVGDFIDLVKAKYSAVDSDAVSEIRVAGQSGAVLSMPTKALHIRFGPHSNQVTGVDQVRDAVFLERLLFVPDMFVQQRDATMSLEDLRYERTEPYNRGLFDRVVGFRNMFFSLSESDEEVNVALRQLYNGTGWRGSERAVFATDQEDHKGAEMSPRMLDGICTTLARYNSTTWYIGTTTVNSVAKGSTGPGITVESITSRLSGALRTWQRGTSQIPRRVVYIQRNAPGNYVAICVDGVSRQVIVVSGSDSVPVNPRLFRVAQNIGAALFGHIKWTCITTPWSSAPCTELSSVEAVYHVWCLSNSLDLVLGSSFWQLPSRDKLLKRAMVYIGTCLQATLRT